LEPIKKELAKELAELIRQEELAEKGRNVSSSQADDFFRMAGVSV
jgi:hypothetical protein